MASKLRVCAWILAATAGMAVGASATAATGSLFICTDATGKTITGDVPPPECANRPIRELNRDGSVRQVIAPPLTPEQRAQKAAEDRRKAEEEKRRRDQARRDRALLDAYGDESEIEQARARAVDSRRVIIDRARKRLDELQRERKKLDDEAEFYVKRQQPERLKRAYAMNADMVKAQEKIIDETDAELKRINERFDADRQRFHELVQGGAKPAQHSASAGTQ